MYSDRKYHGDAGSVGEELLTDIPELEQKLQVVDKAVNEGYFSLDQALSLYKVSELEYLAYLLLKNRNVWEASTKQDQVIGALSVVVKIFHGSSSQFDSN